ncbi:hypothetical protein [Paenibacillus arenosi]|uniref:Aspartyl-phosphate phosphatase Spo0E family protein n=1 Tax=Paenibacillus arenosi TaxID=2774142 RepID=A0ABR9B7F0_9BACL|nr:hypothetical protein [Paenibacillus arenosi]MBD8501066.1 hypothetical protein [Paenibacillus arenosi]
MIQTTEQIEMMDRRNEILRRNIHQYLVHDNQYGLSNQDQFLLNQMVKEWHANNYELQGAR